MAFLLLGILIGCLIGMSAQNAVSVAIPLLFTFAGGSAIAYFSRQPTAVTAQANKAIAALSLGCLVGTFGGIVVSDNHLLSFSPRSERTAALESFKYLRNDVLTRAQAIDQRVRSNLLEKSAAYDELKQVVLDAGDSSSQ